MMKRTGVNVPMENVPASLLNGERTLSGADMEALLTRSKFRAAAAEGKKEVTPELMQAVVDDFIPPTYPMEVELQTLAAVLECTSRDLLPETYRDMDREKIIRRVEELKRLI